MFRIVRSERNHKINFDEYVEALNECKKVAEKQELYVSEKLGNLKKILRDSTDNLNLFINQAKDLEGLKDESLTSLLDNLNQTISENLSMGITNIENSIKRKKENLSTFTVTLFGRTKAGKSTIREALTNGDGETIGKGSQRTTRNIREYHWNNLRIIDTPGISAYEGEEDVRIAESIIDESDLILFLVTNDSIQETEFEKLFQIKSQNKPIIILLNVKVDIDDEIYREIFLNEHREIVSLNGQAGHVERIKQYSKKYLGSSNIEIIPIHALSAFKSTKEGDKDLSRELYNASNINKVKFMLRELIVNQGKQKRVLSFRDDYIYYLRSLENIYWSSYKEIKPRMRYIQSKHNEMKNWFGEFKNKGFEAIESEVSQIFTQLASEVDSFVDNYAGDKNAEEVWNEKVESYKIQEKINRIYIDLCEEATRYINEFTRQITFEASSLNFNNDMSDLGELKKGIIGRVARWGGAALDVAWVVSLTNFWNPAGWVSALIGVGGAIVTIFSWLTGNDSKRFDSKKSKIKSDMKKQINKMAKDTNRQLWNAFKKNIVNHLYQQINIELAKNIKLLYRYLDIVKESAISLRDEEKSENISLFKLLYKLTYNRNFDNLMIKIAREQGRMSKVLTNEDEMLRHNESRRLLENVLGERIIYIEFVNEPSELLKRALFPANTDNVDFELNIPNITIKAGKESVKQIIGKKGRNIRLTNRLFDDFNITVKEI
ncbi:GTPase [Bacillus cereus group sp. MYBK14-1]|uniref:GTPase n=1 Tax=Bacillus cereus group sp. MYBK14-1 TaxID=3450682 RepID=UPI003F798AA5